MEPNDEIRELVYQIQKLERNLEVAKFMLARARRKAGLKEADLSPLFSEKPK